MKTVCLVLASIAAVAAQPAPVQPSAAPRVLFLTGETDIQYHDWRQTVPHLRKVLEGAGGHVRVNEEVRGIGTETLAPYDAVVLQYQGPRWGAAAETAIEEFIRSGRGMVAVHGVSYGPFFGLEQDARGRFRKSAKPDAAWRAYEDLLGMTWAPENIGHAPRHEFTVKVVDPEHPAARGVPAEFRIWDELYHKMTHKPGIRVIASAFDDPKNGGTGKDEPVAWSVAFGKGRVVHITLGHDLKAMSTPGFVALFRRAVEWTAGKP